MLFPKNATKVEKQINWQKIAEINDKDLGFNDPREYPGSTRFCVRIALTNENDEICVVKSEKYGYMQLPGGGIEDGENITEALRRETEEETGWLIDNIEPIGYTIEHRHDKQNTRPWGENISFVFKATPSKQVGTKYMPDEIEEGFIPTWIKIEKFLAKKEKDIGKIHKYSGSFANMRDYNIAKYIK